MPNAYVFQIEGINERARFTFAQCSSEPIREAVGPTRYECTYCGREAIAIAIGCLGCGASAWRPARHSDPTADITRVVRA